MDDGRYLPARSRFEFLEIEMKQPIVTGTVQQYTFIAGGVVGFGVENLEAPSEGPVIYVSNDPKWGRLSFAIQNDAPDNSVIGLSPSSLLKIYLDTLLTDDEIARIRLSANSPWTGGPVNDQFGVHLELRPAQTMTLAPGAFAPAINVENAVGSGAAASGKIIFSYSGFSGAPDGTARLPGFRHNPPDVSNNRWNLRAAMVPRAEYSGNGTSIYVTPWATSPDTPAVENHILLQLDRGDGTLPLPANAKPRIIISFLTGDDPLALCSSDQLKTVDGSIYAQLPERRWADPQKDLQSSDTTWVVEPSARPGDLFADNSMLVLKFDRLVCLLPAGTAAVMFVQYAGLPGYNDGYLHLLLNKTEPIPYVRSFVGRSNGVPVESGGTVDYGDEITWDVFGTDSCQLHSSADPTHSEKVGPAGHATVTPKTPEISYALGPNARGLETSDVILKLNVKPPVAKLTAEPSIVWNGSLVTLTWECRSGDHCVLRQDGVTIADNLALVSSRTVAVQDSSNFEITCVGAGIATAAAGVTKSVPNIELNVSSRFDVLQPLPGLPPPIIELGYWTITATWSTEGAQSCHVQNSIWGDISDELQGQFQTSGGPAPNPPVSTFSIEASNPNGSNHRSD